jgi:uncharacterized protein YyaL (SSP411 family)
MKSGTRTSLVCGGLALAAAAVLALRHVQPTVSMDPNPAPSAPKYTNRLVHSKSPYLLQHAHNPVDWRPWGDEAFAAARSENKPIFLSIGYSTCHWCHVMEHESFENPQVAKVLNDHFVCIKVDREERPDVDRVYMTFVQATTGGGGWPMSVWLTPDLKPFFGGTYFLPPQFTSLLEQITGSWQTNQAQIQASGDSVTRQLRQFTESSSPADGTLGASLLDATYQQIKAGYEPKHGGFGGAPKFPRPVILDFLLRYHARTGTKDALEMSLFTLRKMADGGMHDALGGGFHRYSTDTRWHVPHFEKMLYDQAQLACAYLDAYQITHEQFFAEVARDILDYVRRDMTGDEGQFFSAEDADSPLPENPSAHAEGAFYVWEAKQITDALGQESAAIFNYRFGVKPGGNVESDPRDEFPNKNVLIVTHSIEETAKQFGKPPEAITQLLAEARQKLFALRTKRPRPHLDDKTLTAWNGLMISAFAQGYQVLDDPQYLAAATKSARFIRTKLYAADTGRLLRRYRAGEAAIDGFADDYAFLIQGLLDLYEASFDIRDLSWAYDLQKKQNELFWDESGHGYFSTTGHDPSVLLRQKEDYDGAEPSPNSVAALNLLRLAQMLDEKPFQAMAEKTLGAFGARLEQSPSTMPLLLSALDFSLAKPKQIVIAGQPSAPDTRAMLRAVHARFLPDKIVLLADGAEGQAFLGQHLEFIREVKPVDGKTAAYVCEDYACQLPTPDLDKLAQLLAPKSR